MQWFYWFCKSIKCNYVTHLKIWKCGQVGSSLHSKKGKGGRRRKGEEDDGSVVMRFDGTMVRFVVRVGFCYTELTVVRNNFRTLIDRGDTWLMVVENGDDYNAWE